MAKKAETSSFMMRFTQNIYEEDGESKVQWRGNVSHIQSGEDLNFADFKDAVEFIQQHLADLTMGATSDKSSEEQENILSKSLSIFKTVAATAPVLIKQTLKDPRKQVANLQESISEYGEGLLDKVPIDEWRSASKSDFQYIKSTLAELSQSVAALNEKVDALQTEKPKKRTTTTRTRKTTTKAKTAPTKPK
ncbi:MAG: hypothetical protein AAGJ93_05315 [Bacteroidota bacterium]